MTAGAVGALVGVWAIAVVSPGPDLVVVLQRALAGRRHGLATAAGVVVGITVWLVAAFAGLAAVLRVQPGLMTVLQVAGGLATNLSNPKAVAFFGAVLAPFLTTDLGVGAAVSLVAVMVAVALAWFGALAVAASHPAVHARIGRVLPWVDLAVSAAFVAVGVAFVIVALA